MGAEQKQQRVEVQGPARRDGTDSVKRPYMERERKQGFQR